MSLYKIENPDTFRANIRKKLYQKIGNEKDAVNLEKGIFNFTLKEAEQRKVIKKWNDEKFVLIYTSHLRSILKNLTSHWISEINSGSLQPHKIAFMTHQELDHDRWSQLIEAKTKRDKNKFEVNIAAATDTFTCRKCKGKNCTYYLMQTRAADEPMTCYVTCLDCSNRFKC